MRYFSKLCMLIGVAVLLIAQIANACGLPPEHMYLAHDEAIEDAEWIVLAEAVALEPIEGDPYNRENYKMRVIEYLKGDGPKEILVANAQMATRNSHDTIAAEGNFYGHSTSKFWTNGGNNFNDSDCRIHPEFLNNGQAYLIFGPLDYQNGFENITEEGDVWLQYVRDYLDGSNPKKPFPVTLQSYIQDAKAIVRVNARWDGKDVAWSTDVLKGEEQDYLSMVYLSPKGYFDSVLNPTCGDERQKKRVRAEINRFYVFEELPSQSIWTSQRIECVGPDRADGATLKGTSRMSTNGHVIFDVEPEDTLTLIYQRVRTHLVQGGEILLDEFEALIEASGSE